MRSVKATREEQLGRMPADELIGNRLEALTNAITIQAPRSAVWPWLAQMGAGNRAGWYSYDFLDNRHHHSAEQIIPELQLLSVGMVFPALPGVTDCFSLLAFKPERFLVLGWQPPKRSPVVTWTFLLEEPSATSTRLIVRATAADTYQSPWMPKWLATRVIPVMHWIMQRKQLLGIARRAEQRRDRYIGEKSEPPVAHRVAA